MFFVVVDVVYDVLICWCADVLSVVSIVNKSEIQNILFSRTKQSMSIFYFLHRIDFIHFFCFYLSSHSHSFCVNG